tara:strand:+ start:63 stop:479 length:417 start_codon:yes stop_codon:yes gene_type:complete
MKNLLCALTLLISFFLSAQTSAYDFDIDASSKLIEESEKKLLETEKILKEFRDRGDLGPKYELYRLNNVERKKLNQALKTSHNEMIESQDRLRNAELFSNALKKAKSKRKRIFLIFLISTLILVIIVVYFKRQKKLNQ